MGWTNVALQPRCRTLPINPCEAHRAPSPPGARARSPHSLPIAPAHAQSAAPRNQLLENTDSRRADRAATTAVRRSPRRAAQRARRAGHRRHRPHDHRRARRRAPRRLPHRRRRPAMPPTSRWTTSAHTRPSSASTATISARLRLTSRYRSPDGVTHLAWVQTDRGHRRLRQRPLRQRRRRRPAGERRRLGRRRPGRGVRSRPAVSAARAHRGRARTTSTERSRAPRATQAAGAERATRFSNGDRARLTIFSDGRSDRLAWRVEVDGERDVRYELVVDAQTEQVLLRRSLTEFASQAQVHEDFPGAPSGGTAADGRPRRRPDVAGPRAGRDAPGRQQHPRVRRHGRLQRLRRRRGRPRQRRRPTGCTRARCSTSAGQTCPPLGGQAGCSWDPSNSASTAVEPQPGHDAALLPRQPLPRPPRRRADRLHPRRAQLRVRRCRRQRAGARQRPGPRESNDDSGTDNANMSTPADGASPRMQMYFWTNPSTNSSDAADVVFHEYTHGLTNRSVGTGAGLSPTSRGRWARAGATGTRWTTSSRTATAPTPPRPAR